MTDINQLSLDDLIDKPCGPRKTKNRNAYTKDELVKEIVEKRLLTKTRALKKRIDELCFILGKTGPLIIPENKTKECGPRKSKIHPFVYTVEELKDLAISRMEELGISKSQINKMNKTELCKILFENNNNSVINPLISESIQEEIPGCSIPLNSDVKLRPHQINVVNHMLKRRGLLAIHPTGSGKTLTAVAAANCVLDNYPNSKVIFISPKSLLENFKKELVKFGLDLNSSKIKNRVQFYTFQAYAAQFKYLKKANHCDNSFLIIDEAQNLRATIKQGKSGAIASTIIKCAIRAFKVLLLSATPMKNRVSDIINLITMIDGISENIAPNPSLFNKYIMMHEDAFKKYFACKISMITVPKDDNYPERIEHPIVKLTMSDSYYKNYFAVQEAQEKKFIKDLYGDPSNFKMFYNALRRASISLEGEYSPKVLWTSNKIKESLNNNEKLIVFSNWIDAGINPLRKQLDRAKIKYAVIMGSINEKSRKEYVNAYNRGDVKVLLISAAGSEGIDLKGTSHVILMEPNWNKATDDQIIGRADRYKSHVHLPKDKQVVNIWRLFTVKPDKLLKDDEEIRSVDEILYAMSYDLKNPTIEETLTRLIPYTIENMDCDRYFDSRSRGQYAVKRSPDIVSYEEDISSEDDEPVSRLRSKKLKKIGGYIPPADNLLPKKFTSKDNNNSSRKIKRIVLEDEPEYNTINNIPIRPGQSSNINITELTLDDL
jgi:SNF2 family DNA or RNA helicase